MKQKHILFIVENDGVPEDTRVWNEACAAREYGYKVTAISPKTKLYSKVYEKIDGIRIYRHYEPYGKDVKGRFVIEYLNALLWEFILSIRIFLKSRFHIIHGANPPDHIFLIVLLYKIFGVRYIFDHHDITAEMYLAKFDRVDLFYKILLFMEKLNFKIADVVISTNQSYKSIAVTRGKKKKFNVFVVRNGPDLEQIKFMPPNSELKNGFDYLVAYVGVIGSQDGIDNLLRSIDYIVHKVKQKNIKFILIGKGPNWQEMVDLSHRMNLSEHVEFTGFISYEKLYEILSTADLCVNPEFRNSFTDKSTMLKIMDYMTFGKAIIQYYTKEGKVTAEDAAEYVYHNDFRDFAEKMIFLLHDKNKRQKMGVIGKQRIENLLCWEKQKPHLFNAYRRVDGII